MTKQQVIQLLTQMAENPPWEYRERDDYSHAMYIAIDMIMDIDEHK